MRVATTATASRAACSLLARLCRPLGLPRLGKTPSSFLNYTKVRGET